LTAQSVGPYAESVVRGAEDAKVLVLFDSCTIDPRLASGGDAGYANGLRERSQRE
jgi:hypothetical protein